LRGGLGDREKPPGRPTGRQHRIDKGSNESHEGEAAQDRLRHGFYPRRQQVHGVEGRPDEPAAGDRRPGAKQQDCESCIEAAATPGIGDAGVACDEARRERTAAAIEGDRQSERQPHDEKDTD
jgi:hypothetical protein